MMYYNNLFENLLKQNDLYKDLIQIIYDIVPKDIKKSLRMKMTYDNK